MSKYSIIKVIFNKSVHYEIEIITKILFFFEYKDFVVEKGFNFQAMKFASIEDAENFIYKEYGKDLEFYDKKNNRKKNSS